MYGGRSSGGGERLLVGMQGGQSSNRTQPGWAELSWAGLGGVGKAKQHAGGLWVWGLGQH